MESNSENFHAEEAKDGDLASVLPVIWEVTRANHHAKTLRYCLVVCRGNWKHWDPAISSQCKTNRPCSLAMCRSKKLAACFIVSVV